MLFSVSHVLPVVCGKLAKFGAFCAAGLGELKPCPLPPHTLSSSSFSTAGSFSSLPVKNCLTAFRDSFCRSRT